MNPSPPTGSTLRRHLYQGLQRRGRRRAFARLEPWYTRFVIDGEVYGGSADLSGDERPHALVEAFPDARRVLELGAQEGGHSFVLAGFPGVEEVVAVEGRPANVARAQLVQRLTGQHKIRFVLANLETDPLQRLGRFDAVFCSGLLYHLPEPWRLIEEIGGVSDRLFLCTHYAREQDATLTQGGFRGARYAELGLADPMSGLSTDSFWPTLAELHRMLTEQGFSDTNHLWDRTDHPHGPRITMT
ncbi:MAG TPA: class I SAM-dependent methyltransferase, partial [Mycobacteriales bacterium]|nr:class I SAM-dependent methyltransferase [Mycobacteriales bacterium]